MLHYQKRRNHQEVGKQSLELPDEVRSLHNQLNIDIG